MVDGDSGCAITFNGEIYNFRDIRRELEALGEVFRSSCDTEVILKAYKRWGIDAVERFRGIFALALWDPRARVVHLVRDPMGIKPLYWTTIRDGDTGEEVVLFASEVRALLASGAVPRRLDPAAVASYLWHGFVVGPDDHRRGRPPPAGRHHPDHRGRSRTPGEPGSREMRQYWQMPSSTGRKTTVGELRDELANTVRMQLVADVPLGVFLSGGIDSSAVAALASEAAPGAVHTFTIGFDVAAYDETRYARQVADAIGSRHTSVVLTEQSFQEQLPDAFAAIDQPTFDGINTYFVSRAARERGHDRRPGRDRRRRAVRRLPQLRRHPQGPARRRRGCPSPARRGPSARALDGAVGLGARSAGGLFWNVLKQAPPQTRWGKVADVARAGPRPPRPLPGLLRPVHPRDAERLSPPTSSERRSSSRSTACPAIAWPTPGASGSRAARLLHAISLLELSSFIGERLLRDTDAASMAVALEVRVPLLDHVLAETVAGIDPARRFSPARKKQLLRDVALAELDPAIFDRPKSGFVLPDRRLGAPRLQPQMEAVFADRQLARRVGLRGDAVQTLWRSFVAGRPGIYWSRVWALYVLLSWCQDPRRASCCVMAPGAQRRGGRVLFLSGLQIYPPLSGGTLRSFALVNALKRHGLDVFVYSLVGRKKDYLSLRRSGVQMWPEGIEEYVDRDPLDSRSVRQLLLALPPLWLTAYLRAAGRRPGRSCCPRCCAGVSPGATRWWRTSRSSTRSSPRRRLGAGCASSARTTSSIMSTMTRAGGRTAGRATPCGASSWRLPRPATSW